MPAEGLLLRVQQVELSHGPNVVDMPLAVVVPRHTGPEQGFDTLDHHRQPVTEECPWSAC